VLLAAMSAARDAAIFAMRAMPRERCAPKRGYAAEADCASAAAASRDVECCAIRECAAIAGITPLFERRRCYWSERERCCRHMP